MRFSIVIPVYNTKAYIEECFASLDRQTYSDYEVVIVDDGSTDGVQDIAENYSLTRSNVRFISKENEGPLAARRDGIRASSGDYLLFLDSDDVLALDALREVAEVIEDFGPDIVMFDFCRKKSDLSRDRSPSLVKAGLHTGADFDTVRRLVCEGRLNNLCNKAFKREIVDRDAAHQSYANMRNAEDVLQLLPAFDVAGSLYYLSRSLYYYRPNRSSSSSQYRSSQIDDLAKASESIAYYCGKWRECGDSQLQTFVAMHSYWIMLNLAASDRSISHKLGELARIMDLVSSYCDQDSLRDMSLRPDAKAIVSLGLAGKEKYALLSSALVAKIAAVKKLIFEK